MFVGLLLMAVAIAGVVLISLDDSPATMTTVTVLDRTFTLDRIDVFLAGAGTALIFMVGLAMTSRGVRRSLLRRREESQYRAAARERVSRLEKEKRELERKLDATPTTAEAATSADRPGSRIPAARPAAESTEPVKDQLVAGAPRRRDGR